MGKKNHPSQKKEPAWRPSPLKGSFMAISIIGFFVSLYIIYPYSSDFGFAFILVFIAMFIASIISMTKAPMLDERK